MLKKHNILATIMQMGDIVINGEVHNQDICWSSVLSIILEHPVEGSACGKVG